jgi:hypothetical protein
MPALRSLLRAVGALAAVGVVAAAVLAYLAFGHPADGTRSTTPDAAVVARSMASADAPAAFRQRPTFVSCGQVGLRSGGTIPAARIACLAATPTAGRELVVVSRTAAGEPIVRYFRTGPDIRGVEIFEDATADQGGGWHRSVCRSGRIDQLGACA